MKNALRTVNGDGEVIVTCRGLGLINKMNFVRREEIKTKFSFILSA